MKKISFISLLVLMLVAPVSHAQIPEGPLQDLLVYYANIYSSGQYPTPMFSKKLLAKAQPDECFNGIGNPYPSGPPCSEGQPKVNQAYVWGLTDEGGKLFFGTVANVPCLVMGGMIGGLIELPAFQTPSWVCELGESQLVPPLPDGLGDWRPPKIYEYDPATQDLTDITPLAGILINETLGLRSAGSLNDVIFLAGPNLKGDAINIFAFKSDGTSLGATSLSEYNDIRKWIAVDGELYTAVQNTNGGGTVLKWIGSDVDPFQFEVVGKLDAEGSNIALHEGRLFVTTWPNPNVQDSPVISLCMSPVIPPGGLTNSDAPNWVKIWRASDYEPDMLVVRTYAGGDLASFDGTLFWGTMHVPMIAAVYALQASQQGLMDLDPGGDGLDAIDFLTTAMGTHRSISIFGGKNFGTPDQKIELLYGDQYLPVYDPAAKSYTIAFDAAHQNKMPNPVPKWGPSGIDNFFNTYTWTMSVKFNKLFVGTFDWSYLLEQGLIGAAMMGGQNPVYPDIPLDPGMVEDFEDQMPPLMFGADLYVAKSADEPFILESNDGQGNYLNYGIRTMLPPQDFAYETTPQDFCSATTTQEVLYFGMANAMNLKTDPNEPQGGWELIQLNSPISPPQGTIGTNITISGSFCYPKGNVYIGDQKCKIIGWADTEITAQIVSILPPGKYTIVIKQKDCPEIEYEDVFEIFPPVICSVAPKNQQCGTQFMTKGFFFGSDKGGLKVYIGQNGNWKKCKIFGYEMDRETGDSWCVFVVPKVKVGIYDVKIENKIGSSVFAGGINICK